MIGRLKPKPAADLLPAIDPVKLRRLAALAEAVDQRRREFDALQSSSPGGADQADREGSLAEARGRLAQLRHEAKAGLPVPAEGIVAAETEVMAAQRELDAARPDPVGAARAIEAARQRLSDAQDRTSTAFRDAVAPIREHVGRRLQEVAAELRGLLELRAALELTEPVRRAPPPVVEADDGRDLMLTAQPSAEVRAVIDGLSPTVRSWRRAHARLLR